METRTGEERSAIEKDEETRSGAVRTSWADAYIGWLSNASGSLPDHYLPYLPCDDDDGRPACELRERSRKSVGLAAVRAIFARSKAAERSLTLASYSPYAASTYDRRARTRSPFRLVPVTHTEPARSRVGPLGGSRVNYRLDRILRCFVVFQRAERK